MMVLVNRPEVVTDLKTERAFSPHISPFRSALPRKVGNIAWLGPNGGQWVRFGAKA